MKNFDNKLFDKYLQGLCSREEENEVQQWLSTHEGEKYVLQQMDADIEWLSAEPELLKDLPLDSQRIYNNILIRKENLSKEVFVPSYPSALRVSKKSFFQHWQRIAAVLAGIIVLAFAYWLLANKNLVVEQTAFGETKNITLPDGSTVVMNGNSSLTYKASWESGKPREVWLEGEAFFSIVHTADNQRFFVNTSDQFNIEVLGTTFNVLKRQGKTKVTLNTGKVRLNMKEAKEAQLVVMKPGELVEFDDASSRYTRKNVNPEAYSSWKSRKMVFEQTSLADIILLLEETYGLSVEVKDESLLKLNFNGTVPNDNVDILLEGLSELFDLQITKTNNQVKIQNK